ncbi:hypothetical protein BpHYR1_037738 [Brachionus plicatilis]|uniref:Uncharacterized protein n=1 Tax=Brachionus plicatilis TaxID=10195 RepID=A0A3M7SB15_BRAPC|nr:hypothetical protein BpHYR1_037738 [Brachionus plicatilis]
MPISTSMRKHVLREQSKLMTLSKKTKKLIKQPSEYMRNSTIQILRFNDNYRINFIHYFCLVVYQAKILQF